MRQKLIEDFKRYNENGGTWDGLSKESGITASTISRAAAGLSNTDCDTWLKLHRAAPEFIRPPIIGMWIEADLPGDDFEAEILPGELRKVPCFDSGAGQPSHFSDGGYPVGEASSFEVLPSSDVDKNSFCVTVHGDSMEDTVYEGDMVLIVPSRPLNSGDICFATWPEEFGQRLVKRYRKSGETIILDSDNKDHDPIILDPKKDKDVRIYKVTRLIRKF